MSSSTAPTGGQLRETLREVPQVPAREAPQGAQEVGSETSSEARAIKERVIDSIKAVLPSTTNTALWLLKMMVGISFAMLLLQYIGVIDWISKVLTPFFAHFGLPGTAALAYVSGYFVNCYSALAVMVTLNLDARTATILAVMVLCSHNMIMETAVQHKTGSSTRRIFILRTFGAFFLGFLLNLVLPGKESAVAAATETAQAVYQPFGVLFWDWALRTLRTSLTMVTLVYVLSIAQRLLSEFGVIRFVAKFLRPVMRFFGLPPKTAFLWIVANTLGLAYGGAVMIEEAHSGKISRRDAELLNLHICVSHSNLEDLILMVAAGAMAGWLLAARWLLSLIYVWLFRLVFALTSYRTPQE